MKTRKLGWTDLELSEVGLGTWAHGGGAWRYGWGPQDDADSIAAIRRAIELGVNWIDTAAVYGLGHAEEVLGRALEGVRPRPIVATTCGRIGEPDGSLRSELRSDSIVAECEASLRRLRVEVIDLYQVHWPDPEPLIEEAWAAIDALRRQGKVRYAGVSNFGAAHIARATAVARVASLQPPYSMLRRGIEEGLLAHCAENAIGVVTYSPLQKGLLSGRLSVERAARFPPDDHRRGDPMFQPPQLAVNLRLVDRLRPLAARGDRSVAQLAIAWVLRRREITSAIVGARSARQVEELLAARSWDLEPEDAAEIDELLAQRQGEMGLG